MTYYETTTINYSCDGSPSCSRSHSVLDIDGFDCLLEDMLGTGWVKTTLPDGTNGLLCPVHAAAVTA